jgi:thiamine phosphate synthase YjbQ (UPF0047 family)
MIGPGKTPFRYRYNGAEDNTGAHLERQAMGQGVAVAATGGRLDIWPWEWIFYGELDGCRRKRILAKIIGE